MYNVIINTSDQHYANNKQLIESYHDAMDRAIDYVASLNKINRFYWVFNGDIVSGKDVYRGQDRDNVFSKISSQVQVAAWDTREIVEKIREKIGVEPTICLTSGNHDKSNYENIVQSIRDKMQLYGLKARYVGRKHIINIGLRGKYYILFLHGIGGTSDYSPVSNSMKRKAVKEFVEKAYEKPPRILQLICVGHFHQFSEYESFLGVPMCATGGWHSPSDDFKIYTMSRSGLLVFTHDGRTFQKIPIEGNRDLIKAEIKNNIEYRNLTTLGKIRDKAANFEIEKQKYGDENGEWQNA